PAQVFLPSRALARLVPGRFRQQALGGIRAAVEHHVLDRLGHGGVEVVVQGQGAGVDDAHVHAGGDGVVEVHRVDALAYRGVAAEGKGNVGNAAGDMAVRESPAQLPRRLYEGQAITIVLGDAAGDGEDVRVEDDVLRREIQPLPQQPVRP